MSLLYYPKRTKLYIFPSHSTLLPLSRKSVLMQVDPWIESASLDEFSEMYTKHFQKYQSFSNWKIR